MFIPDLILRGALFLLGLAIVLLTLRSAVRTFVLPRIARDWLTRRVFVISRKCFDFTNRNKFTYEERDESMAMYAPVTLLSLPLVWLALVLIGYMFMYRALEVGSWFDAFVISGSSLLTLGFSSSLMFPVTILEFIEAATGMMLVAIIIAYLPTMYSAFSQRESEVAKLEIRAGSPPAPLTMFKRLRNLKSYETELHTIWITWENWFTTVEETHTSLAALIFFRSPQPDRSWVTAAGAVLDSAALAASTLDIPHDVKADLCIRAGYICLRRISDFFGIQYNHDPKPGDPISIAREEFDELYDELVAAGIPVKSDRDRAWQNFAGWRVNYDKPLVALAALTMAPYAPWSSDRSLSPIAEMGDDPRWHQRIGTMFKP